MKFLRSLPKEWKPMTVSLRHSHEFKDYTPDKLYGVLRTYELEIQQDEEIGRGQKKDKSIALVSHDEDKVQNKSERAIFSKQVCEEKEESSKGKLKMEGTEDLTEEELEEINEHLAFLSMRFSKLKFKRNPTLSRPPTTFRKDSQSRKGLVDRSKFKCYNCGIAGHFSNECRKPKAEKKRATDGIDYKQKYYCNTLILYEFFNTFMTISSNLIMTPPTPRSRIRAVTFNPSMHTITNFSQSLS